MVYFISDVHLGYSDRQTEIEKENLLIRFFEKIKDDCEILYIAGDLFDFWFEYKTVIPRNFYRILTSLHNLRKAGIKIEYLMGNHDFGHRNFFLEELDIPVYPDSIERVHNNKRFYIYHGDGKAYNDAPYLFLRKILRSPFYQGIYRLFHPDFAIRLASSTSKKSRSYTDKKNYGEKDGMMDFAEGKINGEKFDYVIMGHRHRVIEKQFAGGWYYNLGDWIKTPHFGCFDGERMEIKEVEEFLKKDMDGI
jgi:UDP-2,3-diacylglucosamine hydrolase